MEVSSKDAEPLQPPPTLGQFLLDLVYVDRLHHDGPVRTFAFERNRVLEEKYFIFQALNRDTEKRILGPHLEEKNFSDVHKVDTNVQMTTAGTPHQVVSYMRQVRRESFDQPATVDPTTKKTMTIAEAFATSNSDELAAMTLGSDISVQGFIDSSDPVQDELLEWRYGSPLAPYGSTALGRTFLSISNRQGSADMGKHLAMITRVVLQQQENNSAIKSEMKVQIFAADSLLSVSDVAKWIKTNKLDQFGSSNRWILQIPRVWQHIKGGKYKSFASFLEAIFRPLFEVTNDPSKDTILHEFLQQVSGFDTIGAEGTSDELPLGPDAGKKLLSRFCAHY
eukprot:SAG31_NODE_484_length_15037_cov_9.974762_8_plen_337_part_00